MADLIALEYATAALAGAGLTDAQLAHLPAAITAASRAVERYCRRTFTRGSRDERHVPALDGTVMLAQYPVNSVSRISAGREAALTITNASTSVQRATVAFSFGASEDHETGLTPTGLTLTRIVAGTAAADALLFSTHTTIATLAAAVDALGNGWAAEVLGDFGSWSTSELVGGEAAQGAKAGATLDVFADDLAAGEYSLDRSAGVLKVAGSATDAEAHHFDDDPDRIDRGEVRVAYDAGYQTIPADLQDAVAEVAKQILTSLANDPTLSTEQAGQYAYSFDFRRKGARLSEGTLFTLAQYRDLRA